MLTKKIEDALNHHLTEEFESAYLYLSVASYFSSIELPGFAHWMKIQYEEEMYHTMKFYDFLELRDGRVRLAGLKAPKVDWASPIEAFSQVFAHEQLISSKIHELVDLSLKEKDHATNNFLQWFVSEQVEEEATTKGILSRLKMIGDSTSSLLMLDQELSKRVFVPPEK
ncbi:MAG: ferritin [Deltaproteobacteria bacterium]|nr:ferritin [Deltaproteobacteria bacterium]